MPLPTVTGEFRVVEDPELRFAPSGTAVGTVRLVADSKKKVGDEWKDDKVLWIRGTAFNKLAENMAESLKKGDLVNVTGRIQTESWEKDGEKHSLVALVIDTMGPSIKWNVAKQERAARSGEAPAAVGGGDPWSAPAGQTDDPPF